MEPLRVTENADEIIRFEEQLTSRLRELRGSSDRGQIFPPSMQSELKKFFVAEVNADTLALLIDDSPGEFDADVNETYPKHLSLATMPPNLLLQLPDLPPDLEYRFVGRHLILRDARANMVVDEVPRVLNCEDCVHPAEQEEPQEAETQP